MQEKGVKSNPRAWDTMQSVHDLWSPTFSVSKWLDKIIKTYNFSWINRIAISYGSHTVGRLLNANRRRLINSVFYFSSTRINSNRNLILPRRMGPSYGKAEGIAGLPSQSPGGGEGRPSPSGSSGTGASRTFIAYRIQFQVSKKYIILYHCTETKKKTGH